MKAAKKRIRAALVLLLISLGACIAGAVMYPGGWLLLIGFGVGGLCAWQLVGALVTYAQAKAQQRLAELWRKQHKAADVMKLLRQTTGGQTIDQEDNAS